MYIEELFPTFQLCVSGFGVSIEPAILDFLKHVPIHAFDENNSSPQPPTPGSLTTPVSKLDVSGGRTMTRALSVSSLPYTFTPMVSVIEQSWEQSEVENKFLSAAKHYAVKVRYGGMSFWIASLELYRKEHLYNYT